MARASLSMPVDKKGVIRWHMEGDILGSETELEQRIQALLAE